MVNYYKRWTELFTQIRDALGGGGVGVKIEDGTTEGRLLKVNADGSIDVNAELEVGDVEIGAVEIKDHDSDDRLVVESDGSINVTYLNTALHDDASNDRWKMGLIDESGGDIDATNPLPVLATPKTTGSVAEVNQGDQALTTAYQDVFTGSANYSHLHIKNSEPATGTSIFFSILGAGSEKDYELGPGDSMTFDGMGPVPTVRMKGASGGENYNIMAWG